MSKSLWSQDGDVRTRTLPDGFTAHIRNGGWAFGWIVRRSNNELSAGAAETFRGAQLAVARAHKRLRRLARMRAREAAKKSPKTAKRVA
jgi:hypothetical protein